MGKITKTKIQKSKSNTIKSTQDVVKKPKISYYFCTTWIRDGEHEYTDRFLINTQQGEPNKENLLSFNYHGVQLDGEVKVFTLMFCCFNVCVRPRRYSQNLNVSVLCPLPPNFGLSRY